MTQGENRLQEAHETAVPCEKQFQPVTASEEEFRAIKESSVRIYAYANRILSKYISLQDHPASGFALFNETGYLLKLYGSQQYLDWCAVEGIRIRTRWDAASMGKTAVSEGFKNRRHMQTGGEEHENRNLQNAVISFSPLMLETKAKRGIFDLLGGVAIISPREMPMPESEMICAALVNDITLHMFMANELYDLYYQEPRGLLHIDINTVTGNPHILYHNEQVFRVLGIPYENLYFSKADSFFDPLPENEEFWDIVQKRRSTHGREMTLSIRGKKRTYIVASIAYQQTQLGISGIRFFITSPQGLSSQVAKHIGNNAVFSFDRILGESPVMQRSIAQAKSISNSDSNVMITGESGVGKDVFAQAIHNASCRRDRPFIVLNCAAYPRDLLASELFGYDGGAYTGAKKDGNLGKFELADTGTIFLDEIGDMPLDLQVMLLRAVEQKSFMRIGSSVVRSVNVKIISATNADLQTMVAKRTFRPDLYFRLSTLKFHLPPLRERGTDIILLAEHFIQNITARLQMQERKVLTEETKKLMMRLPWSGNVREMQNVMERVVQMVPDRYITPQALEACLDFVPDELKATGRPEPPQKEVPTESARYAEEDITRELILRVLEDQKYNRTRAANALGISRRTFYRKLAEYHIDL